MDTDFKIEIDAPDGLASLSQTIDRFPIELELKIDELAGVLVLAQSKPSPVAGIYFEGVQATTYFFGVTVAGKYVGSPHDVMESFSKVLCGVGLSHRIIRMVHEMEEDEEVFSFGNTPRVPGFWRI